MKKKIIRSISGILLAIILFSLASIVSATFIEGMVYDLWKEDEVLIRSSSSGTTCPPHAFGGQYVAFEWHCDHGGSLIIRKQTCTRCNESMTAYSSRHPCPQGICPTPNPNNP